LPKPSILRACVWEEDAGGREAGAHSTTPTYTVRRDGPCEGAELVVVFYYCRTYYKAVRVGGLSAFWLLLNSCLELNRCGLLSPLRPEANMVPP
jgi:hypothetical protein